jgi:hypothetical protein
LIGRRAAVVASSACDGATSLDRRQPERSTAAQPMTLRKPGSTSSSLMLGTKLSSEFKRHGDTPAFPMEGQRGVGACLLDLS